MRKGKGTEHGHRFDFLSKEFKLKDIKESMFVATKGHEAVIFLGVFGVIVWHLSTTMGLANMMNTIMNTAHHLLNGTVWYLMGVMVLAGAFGKLLVEFGVITLLQKVLSYLMRPLFNLPGEAAVAGLLTFLSDNPAVISLANDKQFRRNFKKYELISLTNFGTAFGMGLVVLTSMGALSEVRDGHRISFFVPALIGFLGAVLGAIVSTRLMQRMIRGEGSLHEEVSEKEGEEVVIAINNEHVDSVFLRFINALLDGGKSGVQLGLDIIPGVLIITTMVLLISNGMPEGGYTGSIGEGVPILPNLASYFSIPLQYMFGFMNEKLVAFPITALGSVGAALGTAKEFLKDGILGGNEVAVFTAIGMCWSGYLSTHTAMLDTLKQRHLASKAIFSHTIGGIVAGMVAHFTYVWFY
jgi:hypothetical protein